MIFPGPYRARPARTDDVDALVELFDARDLADVGFVDPSREDILEDWVTVGFDFERDTMVAEAPDGAIAAYGVIRALDPTVQVFAFGLVHPAHEGRGLGAALLAETERRARARLPPGVRAPLRSPIPETDRAAAGLFTGAGFAHARSFWHMARTLTDVPAPELPSGITLRTGTAGDDEAITHRVLDEAFRENFGYEPISLDDWLHERRGSPVYDPALTVLAFDGDEPMGISLNFPADDGIGWVGDLGVLEGWRGRGVGKALLLRSFAELAVRGHHEVRLGVDAENASGAIRLYRGVGMTVRRRFDVYEKHVTGA